MTDYDVVYFLTCVPVDANNNVIKDPQKKCRSAVMHFGKANLDTFNTGELPNPKTDEFAFVTKDCQRVWEGFMYDVCFDEGKTDPPANHFRHMINPNAYTDKQNFPENTLCGWSAKIPAAHAYSHERSRMVPIYKGDWGRLMKYDGYLCYREYYCTFATPPQGTFVQRCAKRDKPLGLWEKVPPPPTRRFRRMVAVVQPGDGDGQSANISFVERHDMDEGVEVSLDVTGGELKGDEGTGDPLPVADIPPRPEVGKKGEDDDYFEGENLDGELLEEGER